MPLRQMFDCLTSCYTRKASICAPESEVLPCLFDNPLESSRTVVLNAEARAAGQF